MSGIEISQRERQVLDAAIGLFLDTGHPVASGALLRAARLHVSAATVRNTMARLEDKGLLHQPHTSAGRVPTLEAMRDYARRLVGRRQRPHPGLSVLAEALVGQRELDGVIRGASRALSQASAMAGLASPPAQALARISHLELMDLSGPRALVVLVTQGSQIQHHVVELGRQVSAGDLHKMQSWLRGAVIGLTLPQARALLEDEVRQERARCDDLIAQARQLARQALEEASSAEVYVEGDFRLLELDAFEDRARLGEVLRALRDKHTLREVLEQIDDRAQTHVFVGLLEQRGRGAEDQDCSLIVAPYRQGEQWLGWVGVAGPVRMRYRELIPLVEAAAREVSSCLQMRGVA